jgi:hypothetical protein
LQGLSYETVVALVYDFWRNFLNNAFHPACCNLVKLYIYGLNNNGGTERNKTDKQRKSLNICGLIGFAENGRTKRCLDKNK